MCSGLYSHPNVFMEDHINGVIKIAKQLYGENIPEWFYVPLAFHDFGKSTKYFQDYILSGKKTKFSDHSYLSAVYCLNLAHSLGFDDRLTECFLYPLKHHTDLKGLKNTFDDLLSKERRDILLKQIEAIEVEKFNRVVELLDIPERIKSKAFLGEEVLNRLKLIVGNLGRIVGGLKLEKGLFDFNLFFSVLLDADKTQAGSKEDSVPETRVLSLERIEIYREQLRKNDSEINQKREEAFKEVMAKLPIAKDYKLYALTLPTGMGKTLTGLSFAAGLAKNLGLKRIVYSLPFLSIIDQTELVLRGIGLKDSTELIVHHHLSEIGYFQGDREREYDFDTARVFFEGWNSGVILTTFHQFLYALLGAENSYLRRFNKLKDSVVIVDELQALPHRYWRFVKECFKKLTEELNSRVILMTATNPFVFEEGDHVLHLVDKAKYREGLQRFRVIPDLEKRTVEDLAREVAERVRKEDKTFLIILNTIKSSQEFYRKLKDLVNVDIAYLSTAVIPKQRRERIEQIKQGKYKVVVSTQVVEAGVDIDFDVVCRDFAPLDSINQSAGRCNRHGFRGLGEVRVVKLVDDNGREYSRRIYDIVLLSATEKFLTEELTERELLDVIDEYFETLWTKISHDKSDELLEALDRIKHDFLYKNFKLIEDQPYKEDVFVAVDYKAESVLNAVKEIWEQRQRKEISLWEAKREFEKLKAEFYSYVISVALSKDSEIELDDRLKIRVVRRENVGLYYDGEIGFRIKGGENAL
ncbi:helicase [Thermocrinis ruber]|uniref:Helicase n=1 Tax=Thermocrinis ruber TaxID=75906 RepID=W0DGG9_9AQUI|nr:CRISPR-associated helicase/endonuclease Cas3 [Thermocrinis ruber]AHE96133.1 helicase [Thermocrinis ruber]